LTAGVWDDNRNFDLFRRQLGALNPGQLPFAITQHEQAKAEYAANQRSHSKLDISLVIDTTGSMRDEIRYLQSEFLAISNTIAARYPNAEQRWSLVLYRDAEDLYVVKESGFRENVADFRQDLSQATAGGGGDFPEASDQGLQSAVNFAWRNAPDVAKLAFWVADAPHHEDKSAAFASATLAAQQKGIHVYPVASSGIDEFTEMSMRSVAQLTNGHYLFLTDDSGIGNSHKEPSTPCYFVTRLDQAILRMVDIEMTGTYREPTQAELIRTGGDPQNGRCTLKSGSSVEIF
jgi:hypothetical protein